LDENTPSLACESCDASISLTRVRRRGGYLRSIECPECRAVMTWSLANDEVIEDEVIDLRDEVLSREQPDADEVGAPPARDH
jgi:hypothetical protein